VAHSRVGKIIEEIRGKPLGEPLDPRASPASLVLYGLEMRARAIEERRLVNRILRWFAGDPS
jgi:hypothetical protein